MRQFFSAAIADLLSADSSGSRKKQALVLLLETVYRETGIVLNTKKVRLRRKSVSDIIAKERYNIPKGTPSFRCQYRGATLYGKKVQERLGNSACTEDNKVCS